MTTLKQVFLVSFWILLGAITLWGANRAGFLSPEHNSGSLTVLKVDFPEVHQVWKKKEAIFIDARSVSAFKHGHIPGAVNIPVNNVERGLSALPVDRRVRLITYCASVECPNSYQLMQTLLRYGYRNVQFFPRGIRSWQALGYPMEKGNLAKTEKP